MHWPAFLSSLFLAFMAIPTVSAQVIPPPPMTDSPVPAVTIFEDPSDDLNASVVYQAPIPGQVVALKDQAAGNRSDADIRHVWITENATHVSIFWQLGKLPREFQGDPVKDKCAPASDASLLCDFGSYYDFIWDYEKQDGRRVDGTWNLPQGFESSCTRSFCGDKWIGGGGNATGAPMQWLYRHAPDTFEFIWHKENFYWGKGESPNETPVIDICEGDRLEDFHFRALGTEALVFYFDSDMNGERTYEFVFQIPGPGCPVTPAPTRDGASEPAATPNLGIVAFLATAYALVRYRRRA